MASHPLRIDIATAPPDAERVRSAHRRALTRMAAVEAVFTIGRGLPISTALAGWALIAAGTTDLLTVGPAIILASMLGLATGLGHRTAVPLWVVGVVGSINGIAHHGLQILGPTENAQALTIILSIVAGLAALILGLTAHSHSLHYRRSLAYEVSELSPFEPLGNDAPALLKACLSEPACEAYRQAVLKQGRALMLAEARAMIAYAADAPSRKSKEHRERQQSEAWARICSREPIQPSEDADAPGSVLGGLPKGWT